MAGIQTKVDIRGMERVKALLGRMRLKIVTRQQLHLRYAIIASNWVTKNFRQEGRLAGGWKPLKAGTLAGRRTGAGRILQDTGLLRASFLPFWDAEKGGVGSADKRAEWHHEGTRPYVIRPKKRDGLLTFVVADSVGVKTRRFKSGRTVSVPFAKGSFISVKQVNHPGLPKRRLLPTEAELMPELLRATQDYVRNAQQNIAE